MFSLISRFFKNEAMEVEKEPEPSDHEDHEEIKKEPESSDHEEIKKHILSKIELLTLKEKEEIKNFLESQLVPAQETVVVPNYEYKDEPYKKN